MITPYSQSKFITRILTNQAGEQYRVVFLVAYVNGEAQAQVVSAELIAPKLNPAVKACQLFLEGAVKAVKGNTEYVFSYAPIVSPFNKFFFFTSQPTRAPSL